MDDAPTNQQITSTTKKRVCQEAKTKDRTERLHAHMATDHRGPSSQGKEDGGRKEKGEERQTPKARLRREIVEADDPERCQRKVSSSGQRPWKHVLVVA
jgi:hypothetical protein